MSQLIYLDPAFLINAKIANAVAAIVKARSDLTDANIALQQVLNGGGTSFNGNKIETAASHPLVRTGAGGTGQAVNDIVVSILDALNTSDIKDKLATLYQGT